MDEEPLHHPHDKLFKAGFSDPINAAAFLRWEVPPILAEKIDWNQLTLQPGSFIDSQYRHTESDLLFSAPIGNTACLCYLLFEHQTAPQRALALRLLSYMVRIWDTWQAQNPGLPLPLILPIVLAQNATAWNLPTQFAHLLDLPAALHDPLRSAIPDFSYRLIQLATLPFSAIRGTPSGILTLRVMKAERTGQLLTDPVWDEALMKQVPRAVFERLIRYMLAAEIDKAAFDHKVHTIAEPELQKTTMSLAQQIMEEGLQTGLQTGLQNGLRKSLIQVLEFRFGPVPEGLNEAIQAVSDEARLGLLQKAALQADSLEAFAAAL